MPARRPRPPLVFVTVGTDHHPFHRLMEWLDAWVEAGPAGRVRCFVQSGTSTPPRVAEHRDYLGYQEMERLTREAAVVVCHGGPGSVMLVRWAGRKPVVVPRRREFGEHVDDHQSVFARRMAAEGELELVEDEASFRSTLDRALSGQLSLELPAPEERTSDALLMFEKLMDEMVTGPGKRRGRTGATGGRPTGETDSSRPAPGRVLYIGGWGRSGSTLLERVLGQIPGVAAVGEVRELWQRGLVENRPCGCGAAFRDCPFWTEVGSRAYGGWDMLDLDEALRLRYRLDRGFSIPFLLAQGRRSAHPGLQRYATLLDPLYRAIAEVSGAGVVIDSSKLPTHALILRRVSGVDVRLLHLVRDSRGVAYSWQKRVLNRTTDGDPRLMDRYNPVAASVRYDLYNALTSQVGRMGVPYLRIRYEDFVADPRRELARILPFAGVAGEDSDLAFLADGHARLGTNHTVDGNPMRFSVGPIHLKVDDEWEREMPGTDRFWVTTLTAPLLRGYGYSRAPERGREEARP